MERRSLNLHCKKKGNIFLDVMLIIITLFVFGLVAIFGSKLLHGFTTQVNAIEGGLTNESKIYLTDVDGYMPNFFDNLFIFFMILLWIATIILSFMIDSHPVFFIIALFLLIIVVFISFIMGNVFSDIVNNDALSGDTAGFNLTLWVFNHLGIVVLIMGVSIAIALYVKSQSSGGGY